MTPTALGELYAGHARQSRDLAYLLTGDRAVAEDLVQDCFTTLAARLRPVDNPPAFLRRMIVNASHSHHRRLRVRRARSRDEAATVGADTDRQPDDVDTHIERLRLLDALAALPTRQREAVVLRHWLDLSEAQCAAELGCSVGTVKSLASRGRAALRTILEHA